MRKNSTEESKYTVDEAVKTLSKKADLQVRADRMHIYMLSDKLSDGKPNPFKKGDVGIRSLGKIDFLCNHRGYRLIKVYDFKNI